MRTKSARVKRRIDVGSPQLKLFKVSADQCNLRAGDHVIAQTTVGRDFTTGEALQAGCNGVVDAVNWSADDHALFVWVRAACRQST
jgi:hypothetical protein